MKGLLQDWLNKRNISMDIDHAKGFCQALGLEGDNYDTCMGLVYEFEKGSLTDVDFTGGLCAITGKKPEEIVEVLRGIVIGKGVFTQVAPVTPEVTKGTCYEDAYRFMVNQGEGELVHGKVTGKDGRTVKHAWVEFDTGYIWEPQTKSFIKGDVFRETYKPVEDARYTIEEAMIRLVREGAHGAWDSPEFKAIPKAVAPVTPMEPKKPIYGRAILHCPCGYEIRTEVTYWQMGEKLSKYCPLCDKTTIFEVVVILKAALPKTEAGMSVADPEGKER